MTLLTFLICLFETFHVNIQTELVSFYFIDSLEYWEIIRSFFAKMFYMSLHKFSVIFIRFLPQLWIVLKSSNSKTSLCFQVKVNIYMKDETSLILGDFSKLLGNHSVTFYKNILQKCLTYLYIGSQLFYLDFYRNCKQS